MKQMNWLVVMVVIAVLLLPFGLTAQAKGPGKKPGMVKLKPDIVIHNLTVAKVAENPDGSHRVKITVVLRNSSTFTNCTGPFKVLVEWTQDPTAGFTYLREAGVAKLCFDTASIVPAKPVTLFFEDVVPARQFKKYRVTADHLNQVDESNETNNVNSIGYNNGSV